MGKKKLLQLCVVVFCSVMWKTTMYSQVRIDLGQNSGKEQISVSFGDSLYRIVLDGNGVGIINVPVTEPAGYATLYRSRGFDHFYLTPGKTQMLRRTPDATLEFSGSAKDINEYLNGTFVNTLSPSYTLKEEDFISQWEKLPVKVSSYLDSIPLPENFKKMERKRLHYVICNILLYQPVYYSRIAKLKSYTPGDAYYQKLEEAVKEDSEAFGLWEYKQIYRDWIHALTTRVEGGPLEQLRRELDYVRLRIKDDRLADFLIYQCLTDHIRVTGVEGLEEFLPFYEAKVKNPVLWAEFKQMYAQYLQLARGRKAPVFTLSDINGQRVSLTDFLGKYVYMDIWATWCMPCCRELPFLQKLEEQFVDAPIVFVSISIDADENEWKSKVKKDNLSGVQLNVGNDESFKKDYKVKAIPHFVLIDPEGNIIESKMTRPSNSKTTETLCKLLDRYKCLERTD